MRQCMDAENLHRRLKKIIGQVQAIDRMIDEDVPCEDVLAQINAAKSALHRAGQVVLEGHIQHCVRDGIEHGDADQTIANFTKAVERFANMTGAANGRWYLPAARPQGGGCRDGGPCDLILRGFFFACKKKPLRLQRKALWCLS